LLAIVLACEHFKFYWYGRSFAVRSDHQPHKCLLKTPEPAARLARWLIRLENYDFTIEYRKGSEHADADGLSILNFVDEEEVQNEELIICTIQTEQTQNEVPARGELLQTTSVLDQANDEDLAWLKNALLNENEKNTAELSKTRKKLWTLKPWLRIINGSVYLSKEETDGSN
jgi:hypothetical protein